MAMTIGQIVAAIHKDMCDDPANGYCWAPRFGEDGLGPKTLTIEGRKFTYDRGSFECGTSIVTAWKALFKGTKYEHALDAYQYTRNLVEVFTSTGLFEVKPMSFLADPGDMYLNKANHVAMCQTQVPDILSEFCIDEKGGTYGGKVGDQTGRESWVHAYYDYPWDCIVHAKQITYDELVGKTPPATVKKPAAPPKALYGIDIASHQDDHGIDVTKVEGDFVIVKVSGGTSYINPKWMQNARKAVKAGKRLGLYHYACEYDRTYSGKAEAEWFLKQIRGFEHKAVLCLDWEGHAKSVPISYAKEFLDKIKEACGGTPLFYAEAGYINSVDCSSISKYGLWLTSYLNRYIGKTGYVKDPVNTWKLGAWDEMAMYQYSSTTKLSGYSDRLDVNVFYGDGAKWDKLMGTPPAAKTPDKPTPAPVKTTPVRYRANVEGKWLDEMQDAKDTGGSSDKFAGIQGKPMLYFAADVAKYRAKSEDNGWLPWVSKYDITDLDYGCAGDGSRIFDIQVEDSSVEVSIHKSGGFVDCVTLKRKGSEPVKTTTEAKKPATTAATKPKPDNSSLARAACSLAYSRPAWHDPKTKANPGTKIWQMLYGAIFAATDTKARAPKVYNVQGRSCDRSVATAVRWSGIDDAMHRTTAGIREHMAVSKRWKRVQAKWDGSEKSLKPGDVLIRLKAWPGVSGNHVCIFVGHETAMDVYSKSLKGTDADKGVPASDASWVSGHLNGGNPPDKGAAPCIGNAKYAHADTKMEVWRCVDPQGSTKYKSLGK